MCDTECILRPFWLIIIQKPVFGPAKGLDGEVSREFVQCTWLEAIDNNRFKEDFFAEVPVQSLVCNVATEPVDPSTFSQNRIFWAGAVCYRINQSGLWPEPTMVSHFLDPRITNNEAEGEGVLMSLKLVYQKLVDLPDDSDPIEVRLECDSNLVVGQLNGAAAGKNTPHPAL